eukprot:1331066-Amorphochlora_amoeboformis.AAC.1
MVRVKVWTRNLVIQHVFNTISVISATLWGCCPGSDIRSSHVLVTRCPERERMRVLAGVVREKYSATTELWTFLPLNGANGGQWAISLMAANLMFGNMVTIIARSILR